MAQPPPMRSEALNPSAPTLKLDDFRRLFEASPLAIAVSRLADGVFVEANAAFLSMHGYRREEVIGHTSAELGLWRRPEERQAALARLAERGDSGRFIAEYRHVSGRSGRAAAAVTVLEIDGEPHLVGFLSDLRDVDQALVAVAERDARLAFLQEAASLGVWEWEPETGAVRWNRQLETIYGLPPGGFGGGYRDFSARVHPDDLAHAERVRDEAIAAGRSFDVEFRIRRQDGALRWVLSRGAAVHLPGAPQVVLGINIDITERKAAELALEDRERRLAAANRLIPFSFFAQDRDLRYAWLADPGLGLTEQEVLGRTDEEAFGPAVGAPFAALKRRVLATGAGVREEMRVEWKGQSGWFDLVVEPRRDARGGIDGILGAAADITARKAAELALRASEARLGTALKISQLLVFSQDRDLRYTWIANPALGASPAELLGRSDEDIMGAEAAAPLVAIKRRVLRSGIGERHELRVAHGGQAGWFDLIVEPQRDAAAEIVGIACAAADITARKEAEAAAAEAHRQLARLAAHRQDALEAERAALARDVHDQLGATLTGLRLRLEGLADRLPCADEAFRAQLRALAADAEAAQAATRAICARLRPPSLDDLGLAETCRWYLRDWGETTRIRVAGRFPRLAAEPGPELAIDFFRILQELLTNVARHAGAASVRVSLSGGPRGLRLRVADDGRGMPARPVRPGYGLAGIRERAARHGGRVEIDGGPGGTAVTVTCPWSPPP